MTTKMTKDNKYEFQNPPKDFKGTGVLQLREHDLP